MDIRQQFFITATELFDNSDISSESEGEVNDLEDFEFNFEDKIEAHTFAEKKKRNCIKNYLETVVPAYTEQEFTGHFRVSRSLAKWLSENFEKSSYYQELDPQKAYSAQKNVMVWLWFAAHESCGYNELRDRFDVSMGTAWSFIRRVTCFLSDLSSVHIKFPSIEEQRTSARNVLRTKGFPGVIG